MDDFETQFKYFNSLKNICDICGKATQEKKLRGFWWVNNYVDIGSLTPHACDIFFTINKEKCDFTKWDPVMMDWPFLKIHFTIASMGTLVDGLGIMCGDSIEMSVYNGVDLSTYDEDVAKFMKNKTGRIDANVKLGETIMNIPLGNNVYENEEKIYNKIFSGELTEFLRKLWDIKEQKDKIASELKEQKNKIAAEF